MKTLHLLLLLLVFFDSANIFAQEYVEFFDGYNNDYDYKWQGIDDKYAFDNRTEFIKYAKENNLLSKEIEFLEVSNQMGNLINNLFVVDLNGDNLEDIIYSGTSGGEENVVKFFLNIITGYKNIFSVQQGIVMVKWDNKRITKLFTHDWGCCGSIRLVNTVYCVSYDSGMLPKFTKEYQTIETDFMTKPLSYFEKPINFMTANEIYKVRFSPIIDDTTYYNSEFSETRLGNTIGTIKKGTKGKAYASRTDNTGRIWWYVTIDPDYYVDNNILYLKDLDCATWLVGWISSKYITKLE